MNFRKIFKKIITVSAVVGVLATGSVITGYAKYVKVGNTIERFALSKRDSTSFICGNLPALMLQYLTRRVILRDIPTQLLIIYEKNMNGVNTISQKIVHHRVCRDITT